MADVLEVHVSRIQRTAAGVTIAAQVWRLGPPVAANVDGRAQETRTRSFLRSVEETIPAGQIKGLRGAAVLERVAARLVERAAALRAQHRWSGLEAAEVVCRLR